jgi:hypothetical protein
LQLERKIFRPAQFRKFALSALLTPLVFAALLFTVSQSLHEKLHPEASKASHQCAVTLFAQQQILASEPKIDFVEPDSDFVLWVAVADLQSYFGDDHRISASRAPPVSSSLSFVG